MCVGNVLDGAENEEEKRMKSSLSGAEIELILYKYSPVWYYGADAKEALKKRIIDKLPFKDIQLELRTPVAMTLFRRECKNFIEYVRAHEVGI